MKYSTACGALLLLLTSTLAADPIEHRIAEGETLFSIARRYDVSVDRLVSLNRIDDPRQLIPGQLILVPSESESEYRIEPGDTLYSIARRFATTVEALAERNDLKNYTIRVGQRLFVPAHSPAAADRPAGEDAERRSDDGDSESERESAIPVAASVVEPLSFAEGGVWPVPGARRRMDGKLPGVMIAAERGTAVSAISGGRVVYAGPHSTFGNVVFVQTSQGYIYVYGGQESISVTVGEEVAPGATLGTVGLSPTEGGGALYFTVWRNNRFVDPEIAPRG